MIDRVTHRTQRGGESFSSNYSAHQRAGVAAPLVIGLVSLLGEIFLPLLMMLSFAWSVAVNGGGTSGDATKGGMAAAPSLGARDTKGEHVLVMLLERMKSLEGETAAFKAA